MSKFKHGSPVVATKDHPFGRYKKGDTGTVLSFVKNSSQINVVWDGETGPTHAWDTDLELHEMAKGKFRIGDQVVSVVDDEFFKKGDVGTVIEILGPGGIIYLVNWGAKRPSTQVHENEIEAFDDTQPYDTKPCGAGVLSVYKENDDVYIKVSGCDFGEPIHMEVKDGSVVIECGHLHIKASHFTNITS